VEKYFIRLLYIFMDTFQITVLVVAAIILILIFSTIGILTKYSTIDKVYPPVANTCPDYWIVDSSGNCTIPSAPDALNIGNVYSSSGLINLTADSTDTSKVYTPGYSSENGNINFSDYLWGSIGKTTLCAKKQWATTNNVVWDGVSNYNSCV
jgi:hypothetical protein